MPWSSQDVKHKTRQAKTAGQKQAWTKTANAVLRKTGDEGKAIRIANSQARKGKR